MTIKFSSKEIHFLKTDSDDFNITAPETFLGDLLLKKTPQINAFEKRLSDAAIPGETFLCAVLNISSDEPDNTREKTKETFENIFNQVLDHKRGLWETLNKTSFALAFWDYDSEKKAASLLVSLKDKIQAALKTDILTGVAKFPLHDFEKSKILGNALKAADHAAFFGPDALIHFDTTSLNISGDRLYQLDNLAMAVEEYKKGLEIKPNDVNLLNSLGVCYGVMGELDKAKKEFKTAMEISPNEIMVNYNIGLLYQIDGDLDKAIIYLRKAHGIEASCFEVELLLGDLLYKKGQPDQALPHLETAGRINPKSGMAFRIKGEIYLEKHAPEKAGQEFNTAIKLNPSDAVSLSGYAQSLSVQEKNLKIALTFAKNSVALKPDNLLFKERLNRVREKIETDTDQEGKIKTA